MANSHTLSCSVVFCIQHFALLGYHPSPKQPRSTWTDISGFFITSASEAGKITVQKQPSIANSISFTSWLQRGLQFKKQLQIQFEVKPPNKL